MVEGARSLTYRGSGTVSERLRRRIEVLENIKLQCGLARSRSTLGDFVDRDSEGTPLLNIQLPSLCESLHFNCYFGHTTYPKWVVEVNLLIRNMASK